MIRLPADDFIDLMVEAALRDILAEEAAATAAREGATAPAEANAPKSRERPAPEVVR